MFVCGEIFLLALHLFIILECGKKSFLRIEQRNKCIPLIEKKYLWEHRLDSKQLFSSLLSSNRCQSVPFQWVVMRTHRIQWCSSYMATDEAVCVWGGVGRRVCMCADGMVLQWWKTTIFCSTVQTHQDTLTNIHQRWMKQSTLKTKIGSLVLVIFRDTPIEIMWLYAWSTNWKSKNPTFFWSVMIPSVNWVAVTTSVQHSSVNI